MFFDHKTAKLSDERLKTPRRDYIISRQKELILDLVAPHAGERILDVGCGTGNSLQFFREKWCLLTGIDSSKENLDIARQKHGDRAELILAQPEDIPFSDNEFDIVTIINVLEISDNPRKIIEEAIRVCRGRVFIGFINNYSFVGTRQQLKEMFGFPLSRKMRFFSFPEIRNMVKSAAGDTAFKWGSVIYFPIIIYDFFEELEEMFPLRKNPFGAFVGLTFPVNYVYRTAQSPIMESFQLKAKARDTAPEAVRGMLRQADK
ncbi:MAG: class I SAM-dependent methyltransferase [Deltaproteobacteria bacterium]|nr:class I SAM-dependent methyltransferase [Deltaproteobacteria bacterium]